jgi:hypothetical protein
MYQIVYLFEAPWHLTILPNHLVYVHCLNKSLQCHLFHGLADSLLKIHLQPE